MPVRFLPEFDNVLLAYARTGRVIAAEHRPALFSVNGIVAACVLVDGVARAVWRVSAAKRAATLEIQPFARLPAGDRSAVEAEGTRLLAFLAADADVREVRVRTG